MTRQHDLGVGTAHAILRELLTHATAADPNKGRSNAGRWVTINAPRELVERARSTVGGVDSSDGGGA